MEKVRWWITSRKSTIETNLKKSRPVAKLALACPCKLEDPPYGSFTLSESIDNYHRIVVFFKEYDLYEVIILE